MKQVVLLLIAGVGLALVTFVGGYWFAQKYQFGNQSFISPVNPQEPKPYLKYTISSLRERSYSISQIEVKEVFNTTAEYTTYTFSYQTLGKNMTGVMNVPNQELTATTSAVVMLRGYVPPAAYTPGVGTKNAAAVLATQGYITIAPDFFGYGGSEPEFTDPWMSRFSKPIEVVELIKSLQTAPITVPTGLTGQAPAAVVGEIKINQLGLWGHSNGGQIALTVLEILGQPLPTTIWAPVTAPFPYSVLYFSDEDEDEGKSARYELAKLEKMYDVFEFTLTQHLPLLQAPLQIHHGIADDTAPVAWSDEFVDKIKLENQRREALLKESTATESGETHNINPALLQPIKYEYFRYPGADHNLQPGWDAVVQRNLTFFDKHL